MLYNKYKENAFQYMNDYLDNHKECDMISYNMESVFYGFSWILGKITYLFNLIVNPINAAFIASNSIFMYYAKIPARVVPYEVVLITLFGLLASYIAALLASKNIMKSSISEVLRDE